MRNDLATLVGSRICHDLISPIGAIGNGLELLSLTDEASSGAEMSLISDSVENASARIRFFRIAFGAACADQRVSRSEVLGILEANARGGKISYQWPTDAEQSRQDVRIAFLLLQCCETAMPFGGDIAVTRDGSHWTVRATADRFKVLGDLWDGLTKHDLVLKHTAAQVQFALLPQVLSDAGHTLTANVTEFEITATFGPPVSA